MKKYKFSIIDSTAQNLVSGGYRGCSFEWEGFFFDFDTSKGLKLRGRGEKIEIFYN